jgi:hypothetical protein
MTQKQNGTSQKPKRTAGTIALYACGAIVAILAIVFVVNNIMLVRNVIEQYVAQGYPRAEVTKEIMQAQLFPGIIQPFVTFGGVAALLFAAAAINHKVNQCLALLKKNDEDEIVEPAEEMTGEDDASAVETMEEAEEEAEDNQVQQ